MLTLKSFCMKEYVDYVRPGDAGAQRWNWAAVEIIFNTSLMTTKRSSFLSNQIKAIYSYFAVSQA